MWKPWRIWFSWWLGARGGSPDERASGNHPEGRDLAGGTGIGSLERLGPDLRGPARARDLRILVIARATRPALGVLSGWNGNTTRGSGGARTAHRSRVHPIVFWLPAGRGSAGPPLSPDPAWEARRVLRLHCPDAAGERRPGGDHRCPGAGAIRAAAGQGPPRPRVQAGGRAHRGV